MRIVFRTELNKKIFVTTDIKSIPYLPNNLHEIESPASIGLNRGDSVKFVTALSTLHLEIIGTVKKKDVDFTNNTVTVFLNNLFISKV